MTLGPLLSRRLPFEEQPEISLGDAVYSRTVSAVVDTDGWGTPTETLEFIADGAGSYTVTALGLPDDILFQVYDEESSSWNLKIELPFTVELLAGESLLFRLVSFVTDESIVGMDIPLTIYRALAA